MRRPRILGHSLRRTRLARDCQAHPNLARVPFAFPWRHGSFFVLTIIVLASAVDTILIRLTVLFRRYSSSSGTSGSLPVSLISIRCSRCALVFIVTPPRGLFLTLLHRLVLFFFRRFLLFLDFLCGSLYRAALPFSLHSAPFAARDWFVVVLPLIVVVVVNRNPFPRTSLVSRATHSRLSQVVEFIPFKVQFLRPALDSF